MMNQPQPSIDLQAEVWGDLLVSMLSVNSYSLEKAYAHLQGLQSEGLCTPDNLTKWTAEDIASRLKAAGVDRGSFMNGLYSQRLASLGEAVRRIGATNFTNSLLAKRVEISSLLMPIEGIGPKVLMNFFMLRHI
jgi:hypothetical protein